jgi:hypothetical protein
MGVKARHDRSLSAVPAELKALPVWMTWRSETVDGEERKVPYCADGFPRSGQLDSPEDRARLVTFAEIAKQFDPKRDAGFAIALGRLDDGRVLSGIDNDHCVENGKPNDRVQRVIDEAQTYTEISPSGEGVHILGFGDIGKKGAKGDGLEIYSGGRFFTVTGNALNGAELGDLRAAADLACDLFGVPRTTAERQPKKAHRKVNADELRSALHSMDNNFDRADWIDVGHALKYELGESGRRDWVEWSKKYDGYDAAETLRVWDSLQPRGNVTGATIFHHARERGWTRATRAPSGIELLALDRSRVLEPIPPERYVLPGLIPAKAYTLIAGALSTYKTTLLVSMIVWRATGIDPLDMSVERLKPGPAILVFYEDNDLRTEYRFFRVIQESYRRILAVDGKEAAEAFVDLAVANVRRVALTGQQGATLVHRLDGCVMRNDAVVESILAQAHEFAPRGVLLGVDPLRLAITGLSQNEDDGADVVVHTLNYMAGRLPDGGVVVTSHTTKAQAKEPGDGYESAAYATSGSALYSQHARSNFHIARLSAAECAEKFDSLELTPDEARRQPIARLTHGRLSHGAEAGALYVHMTPGGFLVPVQPRGERSIAEHIEAVVAFVAAKLQAGIRLALTDLAGDYRSDLKMSREDIRKAVREALAQHHLEEAPLPRDQRRGKKQTYLRPVGSEL